MAANALVQTRIDEDVKARAADVLERMGLTVSDAVRILLTRTANEGSLPFSVADDPAEYDAWFRRLVQEGLEDTQSPVPAEQVNAEFANLRAASLFRLKAAAE